MTDSKNPVELAQALIRCRSVTPNEGGALSLLENILGEAGFKTHFETFSEPGTDDVSNLYARIGTTEPVLVLAGHTDVVPPGDEGMWALPPFSGEIRDGVLYGRGAVDMKGGLAAMVAAALRYLSGGGGETRGSIAFLITGDEEGPSINGTAKLLEWSRKRGEKFDHCLLGEPTSRERVGDEIKIGRRGSLSGTVTIHGKQGHVAYPQRADNPIRRMMAIMTALLQPVDYGTAQFERSNLEITSVDVGNETVNIIPAKVTLRFNVRFGDAHTLASLKQLIAERLERAANGARYELAFLPGDSASFVADPGPFVELIAAAVKDETGNRPKFSTAGGTSDARYIKDFCPVVELGLVGATMHQVDEQVPVNDLEAVTRIYERVLTRYFETYASEPAVEPAIAAAAPPEPTVSGTDDDTDADADVDADADAEADTDAEAAVDAKTAIPPAAISIEADLEAALEAELNLTGTEAREEAEQAKLEQALNEATDEAESGNPPEPERRQDGKSLLDSAAELVDSVSDANKV